MASAEAEEPVPLLQEVLTVQGKLCTVTLTPDLLKWKSSKGKKQEEVSVPVEEILSVTAASERAKAAGGCILYLAYIRYKKGSIITKGKVLSRTTTKLNGNHDICSKLLQIIKECISRVAARPRSALVLINPISGARKGPQLYQNKVAPVFTEAGVKTEVIVTESAKHVKEIIDGYDLTSIDSLVTVGGDGMYHLVADALMQRFVRQAGLHLNDSEVDVPEITLPIGIIPCGTGNGIALGCYGGYDIESAALAIVKASIDGQPSSHVVIHGYSSQFAGNSGVVCPQTCHMQDPSACEYAHCGYALIPINRSNAIGKKHLTQSSSNLPQSSEGFRQTLVPYHSNPTTGGQQKHNLHCIWCGGEFLVYSSFFQGWGAMADIIYETSTRRNLGRLRYPVVLGSFFFKRSLRVLDMTIEYRPPVLPRPSSVAADNVKEEEMDKSKRFIKMGMILTYTAIGTMGNSTRLELELSAVKSNGQSWQTYHGRGVLVMNLMSDMIGYKESREPNHMRFSRCIVAKQWGPARYLKFFLHWVMLNPAMLHDDNMDHMAVQEFKVKLNNPEDQGGREHRLNIDGEVYRLNKPEYHVKRQRQIAEVRTEIRKLGKAFKKASEAEKIGLHELRAMQRNQLRTLKKAERLRNTRRRKARKRAAFVSNPYRFSKKLLDKEKSGELESSMEEIQKYLADTHCDPKRNDPLEECQKLVPTEEPTIPLDEREPTFQEVKEVVKKARSGSAPGPNGVPYKVYKMCPKLLRRLWLLLKVIWRKGRVPDCWQEAEGIFAPKEKDSKYIQQFRTISLLNTDGKIFFAVLARRMTTYLTDNKYVDTSVQKGGVPGFSGCVEHTSAISQLIREAKVNNADLTVVWLDLANAYGSIPHKVIEVAMNQYHIPDHIKGMIVGYLSEIRLRFAVGEKMTAWQKLEKGIVTGCTISVVLFLMGMNLIIEAAKRETRGPKTASGVYLPSNRSFMDDMTITTKTHVQTRWMLSTLEEVATWARMKFKPKKSRSLIIKNGKTTKKFNLQVQGEDIPSIVDSPIKCLGKWYDASLKDTNSIQRIKGQLQEGLNFIDQTGLPGKFKTWLFQHGLLPRLMWPIMLYEIATSAVENLEKTISKYLRRWLGVPPSFSSIGLYGKTNQLQLPLSSMVEEFKVAKSRLVVTLKESRDDLIRKAGIETRTGRKWSASQAVSEAESRLRHKDIVGTTAVGRQGLGNNKTPSWSSAGSQEKRELIQKEIRLAEEEDRRATAVAMGSQGAWTSWQTTERKLTWPDIWRYEPFRLSFLLRSVYDVLPSPSNLHRWGLLDNPKCQLCDRIGTMEHVLSSCKTALTQGRYRWRHDCVLRDLADLLERERTKKRKKRKTQGIQFVKEGQSVPKQSHVATGFLDESDQWEMEVDLGKN